jgi:hypothetical protein
MAVLGTAPRGEWYTPGEEDEGWDTTEGLAGERGVWERARERVGIPVPHAAARLHADLVAQARAARHS